MSTAKNFRSIGAKVVKYFLAIAFGWACCVFFLGFPRQDVQDIFLRRNYVINSLDKIDHPDHLLKTDNLEWQGEWILGTYSLATIALTNIAMQYPQTAQDSSLQISRWIERSLKDDVVLFDRRAWGEDPLDSKVLASDVGHIGYYGHLNMMLGCYALLNHDGRFTELHRKISEAIARRMQKCPHRHVDTYPFQNYPPDTTVAVASLRIMDMVHEPRYSFLIDEWLAQTRKLENGPFHLIPFQIDSETGLPVQEPRGTNNAWNTFFLPLIDPAYAREQYQNLKQAFVHRLFGFAGVKESLERPHFQDRDTGPALFGFSTAATVLTIAGAKRFLDQGLYNDLLRTTEFAMITVSKGNERRYLLPPVLADAIVLAMKTAGPWHPLWNKGSE